MNNVSDEIQDPPRQSAAQDFDRGFGIGGLGRFEEEPFVPSVQAMRRQAERESRTTICRRCGESSLDGAMFTTIRGGNVCDDCAG